MKRPHLFNLCVVETTDKVSIKASLALFSDGEQVGSQGPNLTPSSPWQSFGLLKGREFRLKITILDHYHQIMVAKYIDTDQFGNFFASVSKEKFAEDISRLEVYEIGHRPGLELLMGTYIPIKIFGAQKIVVSDFDKTLVDTRYSTTKEIYESITRPIDYFPSVAESIDLFKSYINDDFHPFILSASPHFYENAIRDWLYKNKIFTAGVFLKDYRKIISFLEDELSTKDMKAQGFYKLNHLVDILLMTDIPHELVLIGDGFESDTFIYLLLQSILCDRVEPWRLWNKVKREDAFKLNSKQNAHFLNKLYQLSNLITKCESKCQIKIHIRQKKLDERVHIPLPELQKKISLVDFFVGQTHQALSKGVNES